MDIWGGVAARREGGHPAPAARPARPEHAHHQKELAHESPQGMQPPQLALVAGALSATVAVAASLYARSRKRRDDDEEEDGGVARHVYRIVLTGGPCAGKTTALARLSGYLQERGFRVYMIPEMATVMFTNGVAFSDLSSDAAVRTMQRAILDGQLTLEDGFARIAAERAAAPTISVAAPSTIAAPAARPPKKKSSKKKKAKKRR